MLRGHSASSSPVKSTIAHVDDRRFLALSASRVIAIDGGLFKSERMRSISRTGGGSLRSPESPSHGVAFALVPRFAELELPLGVDDDDAGEGVAGVVAGQPTRRVASRLAAATPGRNPIRASLLPLL